MAKLKWTWVATIALGAAACACSGDEQNSNSGDGDTAGDGDGFPQGDGDALGDGDVPGDGDGGAGAGAGAGTPGDGDGDPGSGTGLLPPSQAPELSYCPFDDASDLTVFEGRQTVRVCPAGDTREGCDVDSIAAALGEVANGGRIEIVGDGADYTQCAVIPDSLSDVEIVGVCGRPHIRDTVCQLKGVFLNLGKDITLTNLEVSGAQIAEGDGGNAAAVRDQSLGGLNLRYVYFHDNQNGILGGVGRINIDWSRFEANGSAQDPGYTHNTYFAPEVTNVVINNSLFLRAQHEGNNMKSRAQRMEFHCSVTASLDAGDSREMDISEGGELVITNSIIQQGEASVNSGMLGFATESEDPERRHDSQAISISDTDFINDKASGTFLAYNAYDTTVDLSNVRFVGAGTTLNNTNGGADSLTENNVTQVATRGEAGLPAASDEHMDLPLPPGCPDFEYF